ncbi:MAG: lactobin A/cerein 7B family class IIb bacteriocin [Bacteroidota bacterium]
MEKLDLENYEVVSLDEKEIRKNNGGWIATAVAIASAAIYIYNNGDDFIEGFKEGYNES